MRCNSGPLGLLPVGLALQYGTYSDMAKDKKRGKEKETRVCPNPLLPANLSLLHLLLVAKMRLGAEILRIFGRGGGVV